MSSKNTGHLSAANTPMPRAPQLAEEPENTAADLGILESLAEIPVAEHLVIYDQLHTKLSADLGTTSQEQW